MAIKCEWSAALGRGEYIPVSQCPCPSCKFSTILYDFEQAMLVDGELSANWITTDIDGVREGMNMKLQECIHPGVFATCKSNEYCPSCGHMVPRELL